MKRWLTDAECRALEREILRLDLIHQFEEAKKAPRILRYPAKARYRDFSECYEEGVYRTTVDPDRLID